MISQSHWSSSVLGNKSKKSDFVYQTVSRREVHAGWARDYLHVWRGSGYIWLIPWASLKIHSLLFALHAKNILCHCAEVAKNNLQL